jgi:hypothetical protein
LRQRNSTILRNDAGDLRDDLQRGRSKLVLAQEWHHISAEAANLAIRQNGLQTVAHLGPVLMVVHGEQNHHAAILALWSDAPLTKKPVSEILRGVAFERVNGHDGDLRAGFLIHLLAKRSQVLARSVIQDAGEVIYVPLWRKLVNFLGVNRNAEGW